MFPCIAAPCQWPSNRKMEQLTVGVHSAQNGQYLAYDDQLKPASVKIQSFPIPIWCDLPAQSASLLPEARKSLQECGPLCTVPQGLKSGLVQCGKTMGGYKLNLSSSDNNCNCMGMA